MSSTLAIAERNVPRYTSYPTAPHFSGAVGADRYAEWLAALPAALPAVAAHSDTWKWTRPATPRA